MDFHKIGSPCLKAIKQWNLSKVLGNRDELHQNISTNHFDVDSLAI